MLMHSYDLHPARSTPGGSGDLHDPAIILRRASKALA